VLQRHREDAVLPVEMDLTSIPGWEEIAIRSAVRLAMLIVLLTARCSLADESVHSPLPE